MAEASKERAGRGVFFLPWQGSRQTEKAGPGLGYIDGSPRPAGGWADISLQPAKKRREEERREEEAEAEADRVGESEGDVGAPASGEEVLRPCAREISGTCPLPLPL